MLFISSKVKFITSGFPDLPFSLFDLIFYCSRLAPPGPPWPSLRTRRVSALVPAHQKSFLHTAASFSPAPSLLSRAGSAQCWEAFLTTLIKIAAIMPLYPQPAIFFFLLLNSTSYDIFTWCIVGMGDRGGLDGKESACNVGDPASIPGQEAPATHSSTLVWRIPWTEEPGGLQFMGSQRIRHDRVTCTFHYTYMKPTMLFLKHLFIWLCQV